jgi:hypothetical protein
LPGVSIARPGHPQCLQANTHRGQTKDHREHSADIEVMVARQYQSRPWQHEQRQGNDAIPSNWMADGCY